jgi:hypothetical protein
MRPPWRLTRVFTQARHITGNRGMPYIFIDGSLRLHDQYRPLPTGQIFHSADISE